MNVEILNNKAICESLLTFRDKSVDSLNTKKILTDFYQPNDYLFFKQGKSVLPLIIKNGLVTYYGGLHYNEQILLPNNKNLINYALNFIKENNLKLRLLSIKKDPLLLLNKENINYDKPFNQYWTFKNINKFKLSSLINNSKKSFKYKIRWMLKSMNDYSYINLTNENFKKLREKIITSHINFFNKRNLPSGWEGKESLFINLTSNYIKFNMLHAYVLKKGDEIVGCNIIIKDSKQITHWFTSRFDDGKKWLPIILYLKALESAKSFSKSGKYIDFNATRGAFYYKPLMGFQPSPSYALVIDSKWKVQYDKDLDVEQTNVLYGREFGGLLH